MAKTQITVLNIVDITKKGDIIAAKTHSKKNYLTFKMPKEKQQYPKKNDKILVRIQKQAHYNGEIIRLFQNKREGENSILAITKKEQNKLILIPIEKNEKYPYIIEKNKNAQHVKENMLIRAIVKNRQKIARISDVIHQFKETDINPLNPQTAITIAQYQFNLNPQFPKNAITQAETLKPLDNKTKHQDYTNIPFITIDPHDAKDHDDAIFAEVQKNNKTIKIIIAIADVAYYVTPNSPLDKEAFQRGNSIYFPGAVIPMLPEKLSNNLCSLKKDHIRPAIAAEIYFDKHGTRLKGEIKRIKIKTAANLTYEQAQNAIDNKRDTSIPENITSALRKIIKAWRVLQKTREKRQPLNIDIPEYKIILKQNHQNPQIDTIQKHHAKEAHNLIEEYMIQANTLVAEILDNNKTPFIARQHKKPETGKVEKLNDFLKTNGVTIPKQDTNETQYFNNILKKPHPNPDIIHEAILRTQAQALYTHQKTYHFGLNLKHYTHFTSPIRRYCDLTIHRQIIDMCNLHISTKKPNTTQGVSLEDMAEHISQTERNAIDAERATHARLTASHINNQKNRMFPGYICGIIAKGLFVRLEKNGAEGFIPTAYLTGGKPNFNAKRQTLTMGRNKTWKIGQSVIVHVEEVNPFNGNIRCIPLEPNEKQYAIKYKGKKSKKYEKISPNIHHHDSMQ